MKVGRQGLFFLSLVLLISCRSSTEESSGKSEEIIAKDSSELEDLKKILFGFKKEVTDLPVYADPATGDYDEVRKGNLIFQFDSTKIPLLKKYRGELEPLVLQYIDSGLSYAYLSAYLKYESALPKLKQQLLAHDDFYGWEGGDYTKIDRYMDDEQFPYQNAYIASIEYITGKPISRSITLTDEERKKLEKTAKKCAPPLDNIDVKTCFAKWFLLKMDGK